MSAASEQAGLRLRQTSGGAYALEGELDMATAPAVDAAFAEISGSIRLDLGALRFLDSCGVAALLRLRQRCQADGCHLRIDACSPSAARVLRIVGLYDMLIDSSTGRTLPPTARR
jgi:anti-anti-sigma factor